MKNNKIDNLSFMVISIVLIIGWTILVRYHTIIQTQRKLLIQSRSYIHPEDEDPLTQMEIKRFFQKLDKIENHGITH